MSPRSPRIKMAVVLVLAIVVAASLLLWNYKTQQQVVAVRQQQRVDGLGASDGGLLSVLRSHFLEPPSLLPYNLTTDRAYLASSTAGSWPAVHSHLRYYFSQQHSGFFVEAGALDGQMLSNTLWLEQHLGWSGLLVEPDPASYQALRTKHRKAWTSNACLSQENVARETVHVSSTLKRNSTSRWRYHMRGASYQFGITRSSIFDRFLNLADLTYTRSTCFPLLSYLLALNVSTVDLLSLDTQGTEINTLKSLPWPLIHIRVLVVEIEDRAFARGFVEYMALQGYRCVDRKADYYFVKEGDPILARSQSPKNKST